MFKTTGRNDWMKPGSFRCRDEKRGSALPAARGISRAVNPGTLRGTGPWRMLCMIALAGFAGWAEADTPSQDVPAAMADLVRQSLVALEDHGAALDSDLLQSALLNALLEVIDPRGTRWTAEEEVALARRRAGKVFDIGVALSISTNGAMNIIAVAEDSPAQAAGLSAGDTLKRVGDLEASNMGLHRAYRLLQSDRPDPVQLVTQNADGVVHTQAIARVTMTRPSVAPQEELPFQLGLIRLHRLDETAARTVPEIMLHWSEEEFAGAILDLRGADGDDLEAIRPIADLFASEGSFLFDLQDAQGTELHAVRAGQSAAVIMPVMALIDGKTGGAAEVLAAVLSDSVRGVMLFGQPTRGDLLLREPVTLPDGSAWNLTTRRLVTDRDEIYGSGAVVRPDVHAEQEEKTLQASPTRLRRTEVLDEEIEQERLQQRLRGDPTLRRAVDVLLGLKALDIRPGAGREGAQ